VNAELSEMQKLPYGTVLAKLFKEDWTIYRSIQAWDSIQQLHSSLDMLLTCCYNRKY